MHFRVIFLDVLLNVTSSLCWSSNPLCLFFSLLHVQAKAPTSCTSTSTTPINPNNPRSHPLLRPVAPRLPPLIGVQSLPTCKDAAAAVVTRTVVSPVRAPSLGASVAGAAAGALPTTRTLCKTVKGPTSTMQMTWRQASRSGLRSSAVPVKSPTLLWATPQPPLPIPPQVRPVRVMRQKTD